MSRAPWRAGTLAIALCGALMLATSPVSAATISATDGDSTVSIKTPIVHPALGSCTRVPYSYTIASDVDVATAVIVDADGGLIARGPELISGDGTDELRVCGVNLSGKTAPYTLRLRITYPATSQKPATELRSTAFRFAPRTIRCRKLASPNKGVVRTFTTTICPRGWVPARR